MTGERRNSGISGDGRRRAPSRSSSTAAQSAKRRGNRKVVKSQPPRSARALGWLVSRPGAWLSVLMRPLMQPQLPSLPALTSGFALRAGAAVAVGAVVAIGAHLGWRALSTSPTFAVDDIEVTGAVRATPDELRALAAVEPGDNSLALDTVELARLVEKHPWVSSARVLRRLPRGLTIEVEEHAPVALVALEHLYYVDADGEVVKRLVPGEREALPVITGLSREDVEHSDALALSQIRAALSFIAVWSRAQPESALDEVNVGPSGDIAIGLADPKLRIHLGPAPWDEAIARSTSVREEARERGFVPAEIAAWSERHPERAVVRIAAIEGDLAVPEANTAAPGKSAPRPREAKPVPAGKGKAH